MVRDRPFRRSNILPGRGNLIIPFPSLSTVDLVKLATQCKSAFKEFCHKDDELIHHPELERVRVRASSLDSASMDRKRARVVSFDEND